MGLEGWDAALVAWVCFFSGMILGVYASVGLFMAKVSLGETHIGKSKGQK